MRTIVWLCLTIIACTMVASTLSSCGSKSQPGEEVQEVEEKGAAEGQKL